jgi:hypothetical protein
MSEIKKIFNEIGLVVHRKYQIGSDLNIPNDNDILSKSQRQ